jgi:hypothetical protein
MNTSASLVIRRPLLRSVGLTTVAIALGLMFAPSLALARTASADQAGGGSAVTLRRSHRPPRLLVDDVSRFVARPAALSFGAGAGVIIGGAGISQGQFESGEVGHISWSRWTSASAAGHGLIWINDCSPNCPEGTYQASPVTIRARDGFSGRYRRLSYVYRADGRREHVHWRLKRIGGTPDAWTWW